MKPLELIERISIEYQNILNENLCGIYLHGSLAFGCFNQAKSDIDFLVVVYDDIKQEQKEALIQTLIRLNEYAPAKGFEMSVVLYNDCKTFIYPTPFLLHFSNAHIKRAGENLEQYCRTMNGTDKDLAAHFTVVRKVGIAVYGKPVSEVFGEVPAQYYFDSIKFDIENAENDIENDPVYIILNLCRVIAFIKEGLVLSKQQGGAIMSDRKPDTQPLIIKGCCSQISLITA